MADERDVEGERDFEREVLQLRALMTSERVVAVERLRALHEAWARVLVGAPPVGKLVLQVRSAVEAGIDPIRAAQACEQLHAAEGHQWEIGTWSSGSGEGLASMAEVRALQVAQAWLWAAQETEEGAREAASLLAQAMADPNGSAVAQTKHMQALQQRLNLG